MNKKITSNVGSDDDYGIFVADDVRYVNRKNVLVTDLDGTLIKTDLLYESLLSYLKINFFAVINILIWAMKGKAWLKKMLASQVSLNVETLPYNKYILNYLRQEKAKGRYLVIASASTSSFVNSVANHLGIFDETLSSGRENLSGKNKADLLVSRFGTSGFEYIGNSNDDVPIWNNANTAVIVSHSSRFAKSLSRKIKSACCVDSIIDVRPVSTWLKAIRLHQWVKNLLVFFPILASHRFLEWDILSKSLLAFFSFSLCASSIYIVNDLLDLQEDRKHPSKSKRAFASGGVDILTGAKLFSVLITLAIVIAMFINTYAFYVVIATYTIITFLYSMKIKQVMMADVIILACLYTMRIVAGAMATGIKLSMWLLIFSIFAFCGLALLKRFGELSRLLETGGGRGYQSSDTLIIAALGIGSSLISILIFIFYINDPFTANLYSNSEFLWILVPVFLYWFGRIWILASRGLIDYDPILFVTHDYASLFCGLVGLIVIIMAL